MAKTNPQDKARHELIAAFESFLLTLQGGPAAGGKVSKPSKDAEEVEADEDEEEEELELLNREEVESLGIKELRTLAAEYLEDAPTKKADILAALEEFYDEEEEEEDDEVEDDEDEEEDEEGEYDRDDLEELDLPALRKIAKEEGHTAADYKGMDQDALIDLILGEGDEDEEDEEDEEEEDDDDVEELDEDALAAMSHKELIALAKELEIKVPKAVQKSSKANQKKLVDLILDSGEDDE